MPSSDACSSSTVDTFSDPQLSQKFHDALVGMKFSHASIRWQRQQDETLTVRQGVVEPPGRSLDEGAMITVFANGGIGWGATSDLSAMGLRRAAQEAWKWAQASAARSVVDFSKILMPSPKGQWSTPVKKPWMDAPLADKIELLQTINKSLKISPEIVDWSASTWCRSTASRYITADGGDVRQLISMIMPGISVRAANKTDSQQRSLGGYGLARQGGLEALEELGFFSAGPRVASEAMQLLSAENCPSETMDVILDPDQMILQIHESIGHPLELDRILGDERNYAGRSFVTKEMFGSYRYGSELLNITFDPTVTNEVGSYGFDDEGTAASREYIIKDGILMRPLGGTISQQRTGLPGVANARAVSWNRPAIDRMATLNLEPGRDSLDSMISSIKRGIWLKTNSSWSIDDSRNKFQFSCEWGQLIENGSLTKVVKNPSYRGISANFWRSLSGVGTKDSHVVMGTPYCGKGEPNQAIPVGHASPPCRFTAVEVFGGEN